MKYIKDTPKILSVSNSWYPLWKKLKTLEYMRNSILLLYLLFPWQAVECSLLIYAVSEIIKAQTFYD